MPFDFQVQLANSNQLGDHYASKHPKEKPPAESSWFILVTCVKKRCSKLSKHYVNECVWLFCHLNSRNWWCMFVVFSCAERYVYMALVLIFSSLMSVRTIKNCFFQNQQVWLHDWRTENFETWRCSLKVGNGKYIVMVGDNRHQLSPLWKNCNGIWAIGYRNGSVVDMRI